MLGRGLLGRDVFWSFSSKEIIKFHPNLVGVILKGKRLKVDKMARVALGGGPPRIKQCKLETSS